MGYIQSDELIEVTPEAIRLRKKELDQNRREQLRRLLRMQAKNAATA